MRKVHNDLRYDFYIGTETDKKGFFNTLYNIVPRHQNAPTGGYKNMKYIEGQKGVEFPARYQRKKYGMSPLYVKP